MKKKTVKKYLIEAFLIIFSVLLALLLNKAFENYKVNRQARIAKESMAREMAHNLKVTTEMRLFHQKISERVSLLLAGDPDSIKNLLFEKKYLGLEQLTEGESIMTDFLRSTAWETARSTGIISEFKYHEVETLTKVYFLQDIVLNKTLSNIVELFFQSSTHDPDNIEKTLMQFQLRFRELAGQEYLLIEFYNEGLSMLESDLQKQ